MKNGLDACVCGIVWWSIGYGLAYGEGNGFIGTRYFFGQGFNEEDNVVMNTWLFKFIFASTAATIVSGSLAERVNIDNYLLFTGFMSGLIYPVIVASIWANDGWLRLGKWNNGVGFQDFAGAGVVHLTGGVAGFIGAWIIGPRIGIYKEKIEDEEEHTNTNDKLKIDPHGYAKIVKKYEKGEWDILRVHQFIRTYIEKLNESEFQSNSPQQAVMGALILWVGWLLFNAGSSFGVVGDKGMAA